MTRPLASFSGCYRKDPPFDMEYIYITYLLERAETAGVPVFNRPASLRDCNEKFFATAFPKFTPPLIVSKRTEQLRAFAEAEGDVVMKPLDGMGGASIFRLKPGDSNLSVVIETLTAGGSQQIMAQRYLPEIKDGDKRILMIEGKPVPYALARIPAAGESRGNLAAGGRGEARPLTDRDREIAEAVGPELARGLSFVGMDVIGTHLTEVNVTCPTCIRELDAQRGLTSLGIFSTSFCMAETCRLGQGHGDPRLPPNRLAAAFVAALLCHGPRLCWNAPAPDAPTYGPGHAHHQFDQAPSPGAERAKPDPVGAAYGFGCPRLQVRRAATHKRANVQP